MKSSNNDFQVDFVSYHTVTKDLASHLRQPIINGDLSPGERLVGPLLVLQMKASRTPVREAILQLENKGLAAWLACDHVTEAWTKQLCTLLKQMEDHASPKDLARYTGVCREFHRQIIDLADYRWLLALIGNYGALLEITFEKWSLKLFPERSRWPAS